MSANIWNVLSAALTGSSELFLLCAVGAFLCHKEILTRQVGRSLSRAILNAFLPALLFGSIIQTVHSLKQQPGAGFLVLVPPVCAILVLIAGVVMGTVIIGLFGYGLHPMVKRACVMCVCFGNSNTMPMLIMHALCESFEPLENAAGSVEMCKAKTTGFLSLYLIVWSTLFWGVGLRYVIGWDHGKKLQDGDLTGRGEGGGADKDLEEQAVLMKGDEDDYEDEDGSDPKFAEQECEKSAPKPPGFLTPPVIAIISALILGYMSKVSNFLLETDGPLQSVKLTLKLLGNTAIPMSSLLVGSKLFASRKSQSSDQESPVVGARVIIGVMLARMVLLPAAGSFAYVMLKNKLPTKDLLLHTVLLAEFNTPSASNNVVMAQIASIYRPDVGQSVETTVASLIFWQYVVSPLLLTANTAINLGAVFRVASETIAFSVGVQEALELLGATTIIIPIFRRLKLSPILGFLLAGVILGPHGLRLIKDVEDITELADFGVLFLLFEMGLELSLDRLAKLRKYAFGLGTLQMLLTSLILGLGAYAMGANPAEAAVVGSALSLSSSAFVLQLLGEGGERQSRAGVATFGVLLFQDIAVVPLLVLIPFLGTAHWLSANDIQALVANAGKHVLKTLSILNLSVVIGGQLLKRVFKLVADSKSSEAFTSAVLLTVLGTAWLTEELGLSMTLGAFLAGVFLAETSFRSRIAVDLEPFRGLFLGLFFITTGMSMDMSLFIHSPGKILFLISALIFWKASTITILGLPFGLSLPESLRAGLLMCQGGEFSFVLFALANHLGLLPDEINSFLITTVVTSMALTPLLYEVGRYVAPKLDKVITRSGGMATVELRINEYESSRSSPVIIFGFGPVGKVIGRMLSRKFIPWVAVDIDPSRVKRATDQGLSVLYGDSVHPQELLKVNNLVPCAFVVTHTAESVMMPCIDRIRESYPTTPVYVRARDVNQQKKLLSIGANATFSESFETSLQLGEVVLKAFDTKSDDVESIKREVRSDSGLGNAFAEYEKWFKDKMVLPRNGHTSSLEGPGQKESAQNMVAKAPRRGKSNR